MATLPSATPNPQHQTPKPGPPTSSSPPPPQQTHSPPPPPSPPPAPSRRRHHRRRQRHRRQRPVRPPPPAAAPPAPGPAPGLGPGRPTGRPPMGASGRWSWMRSAGPPGGRGWSSYGRVRSRDGAQGPMGGMGACYRHGLRAGLVILRYGEVRCRGGDQGSVGGMDLVLWVMPWLRENGTTVRRRWFVWGRRLGALRRTDRWQLAGGNYHPGTHTQGSTLWVQPTPASPERSAALPHSQHAI